MQSEFPIEPGLTIGIGDEKISCNSHPFCYYINRGKGNGPEPTNQQKEPAMAKTVNYTEEQVKALVGAYDNAGSQDSRDEVVAEFAEKFGKSIASIRAKLSREGVYVKRERMTKDGRKVERKAAKVARIATYSSKPEEFFESLEKANAAVLDELLAMLS